MYASTFLLYNIFYINTFFSQCKVPLRKWLAKCYLTVNMTCRKLSDVLTATKCQTVKMISFGSVSHVWVFLFFYFGFIKSGYVGYFQSGFLFRFHCPLYVLIFHQVICKSALLFFYQWLVSLINSYFFG